MPFESVHPTLAHPGYAWVGSQFPTSVILPKAGSLRRCQPHGGCVTSLDQWYCVGMSVTMTVNVGPKGRIVIPQSLRARRGWTEGTVLVLSDDDEAVRLMSANEALARFRLSVAGSPSPVDELIAERRRVAELGE